VFYIIIIITLLLVTAGFLVYVYSIFISKNEDVQNGMLGDKSKYHFIPILCISFLFIIGESLKKIGYDLYTFAKYSGMFLEIKKVHCAFNLIFDIIGIASLIYIYLNTKISKPLYVNLIIRKGVYSCFIALLIYNFFYVCCITHLISDIEGFLEDFASKWLKNSGYCFSIFIGVVNILLSVFLKDLMIGIINFFIYLGLIANFFKIEDERREFLYNNNGIGGLQIFMLICSCCSMVFIVMKFKKLLLE